MPADHCSMRYNPSSTHPSTSPAQGKPGPVAPPCSRSGPTSRPLACHRSARTGRAARVFFQLPRAEVQSESWSRTVAPGTRVAVTSSTTDSGVAPSRQSRPQLVHNTGCSPVARAAVSVEAESAP